MNKLSLLIAVLFLTPVLFAQQKTSFGIRAGIAHSGLRGEAMTNLQEMIDFSKGMITTKDRTGFFAGGYASIPVGPAFSVEPGLYYTQRGYAMRGELDSKGWSVLGANAKAQLNTHYIDLPVVLKASIGGLQLFAGPQFSYLAKADLRATAGALGFNVYNRKWDATDEVNRFDAGFTGGIGFRFNSGVNISASYDHGLVKTDANERFEAYNRTLKVGVGFSF